MQRKLHFLINQLKLGYCQRESHWIESNLSYMQLDPATATQVKERQQKTSETNAVMQIISEL